MYYRISSTIIEYNEKIFDNDNMLKGIVVKDFEPEESWRKDTGYSWYFKKYEIKDEDKNLEALIERTMLEIL